MTLWKYRKKGSDNWRYSTKLPTNVDDLEIEIIDEKVRVYGEMQ